MVGTLCCATDAKITWRMRQREHTRRNDQPAARLCGQLRDLTFDLGVGADSGSRDLCRQDFRSDGSSFAS